MTFRFHLLFGPCNGREIRIAFGDRGEKSDEQVATERLASATRSRFDEYKKAIKTISSSITTLLAKHNGLVQLHNGFAQAIENLRYNQLDAIQRAEIDELASAASNEIVSMYDHDHYAEAKDALKTEAEKEKEAAGKSASEIAAVEALANGKTAAEEYAEIVESGKDTSEFHPSFPNGVSPYANPIKVESADEST